jgi:hypothetical protein
MLPTRRVAFFSANRFCPRRDDIPIIGTSDAMFLSMKTWQDEKADRKINRMVRAIVLSKASLPATDGVWVASHSNRASGHKLIGWTECWPAKRSDGTVINCTVPGSSRFVPVAE